MTMKTFVLIDIILWNLLSCKVSFGSYLIRERSSINTSKWFICLINSSKLEIMTPAVLNYDLGKIISNLGIQSQIWYCFQVFPHNAAMLGLSLQGNINSSLTNWPKVIFKPEHHSQNGNILTSAQYVSSECGWFSLQIPLFCCFQQNTWSFICLYGSTSSISSNLSNSLFKVFFCLTSTHLVNIKFSKPVLCYQNFNCLSDC